MTALYNRKKINESPREVNDQLQRSKDSGKKRGIRDEPTLSEAASSSDALSIAMKKEKWVIEEEENPSSNRYFVRTSAHKRSHISSL
ncbi:hypothetical protein AVEN_138458-1 [Araneus ventricosus]|uniref:Uncharacterized protein n=1 Tax=Araneus ventricosus TaxID=182803 RepID=A0A4Y2CER0_ARAVE|nr:hypothetical protein AVEN_138458-1 [Araneus ventricosus]